MTTLTDDKFINASLLQKAIRRGHTDFALAATGNLARLDHQYLVRRLGTIALEDIGLANMPLVTEYLKAAVEHLAFKPHWENSLRFAAEYVIRFCDSLKSRYLTEVSFTAHFHPAYRQLAFELGWLTPEQLRMRLKSETDPIAARCVRMALKGYPETLSEKLRHLDTLCRRLRTEGLNWAVLDKNPTVVSQPSAADVSPTAIIGGFPSYTFDKHTRAGTKALHLFLKQHLPELHHLPHGQAWWALYLLLFEAETGVLNKPVVVDGQAAVKEKFWECAIPKGYNMYDMLEWLVLVKERLPLLDECRRAVRASS